MVPIQALARGAILRDSKIDGKREREKQLVSKPIRLAIELISSPIRVLYTKTDLARFIRTRSTPTLMSLMVVTYQYYRCPALLMVIVCFPAEGYARTVYQSLSSSNIIAGHGKPWL